ncbi:HET-domain-containing protein [Amniculicola lignicola CBS 123094]|uniref:HET-domain-containing protein n=1 Tax=Amniculicola lignicola CBS 123094 TaxID=1392246 RepID=A0A6A5W216_9PLEO|nr:HET-domain-containing protein [Amniculicola lignicola CBS 123094]
MEEDLGRTRAGSDFSSPANLGTKLCDICRTIDFNSILSSRNQRVGVSMSFELMSRKGCVLCDFLVDILPEQARKNSIYSYRICSWSPPIELFTYRKSEQPPNSDNTRRYPESWTYNNFPVLCLDFEPVHPIPDWEHGPGIPWIFPSLPGWTITQPLSDLIDFKVPRMWQDACLSFHSEYCGQTAPPLEWLKVIDCNTRKIVPLENHDYVSLSYVWGTAAHAAAPTIAADGLSLPEELPRTIEDAIAVTLLLNYRYLWIDKFCIDKSNNEKFVKELGQMDLVYRNSVLTIIDACGEDPSFGLPGVRPGSRCPHQPSIQIGEHKLLSDVRNPQWLIKNSPWSTRGWTYQEGLLSRRRLIFTSEQIYFECHGFQFKESVNYPVINTSGAATADSSTSTSLQQFYPQLACEMFELNLVLIEPYQFYRHITEYSERFLSHQSDILNGMLGFFRYTQELDKPLFHLWGLPFHKTTIDRAPKSSSELTPSLTDSFRWMPENPSRRRKGFPSWSWTGWEGKIIWPIDFDVHNDNFRMRLRRLADLDVTIQTKAGQSLSFDAFFESYSTLGLNPNLLACILRIRALSFVIRRLDPQLDEGIAKPCFEFHTMRRRKVVLGCDVTTSEILPVEHEYIAFQYMETGSRYRVNSHLMVLMRHGKIWERVALGIYEYPTENSLRRWEDGLTDVQDDDWMPGFEWREIMLG